MAAERNAAGKFSSGDGESRKPSTAGEFNLAQSLRNLFSTAERAGDFSGAATIARVLRDIDGSEPPAANNLDPDRAPLSAFTASELHRFEEALRAARAVQREVHARLGLPPLTPRAVDRP